MKTTFLLFFLLSAAFCRTQSATINRQFIFNGKIIGQINGIISLTYNDENGIKKIISSNLKNGKFHFKGFLSEPTLAILRGDIKSRADDDPNAVSIYLEPGSMKALARKNHFKEIKITGSKSQNEYEMLQMEYEAIDSKSELAYEKFSKLNYKFITTHPDSYISAFQLALYKTRWPLDSVRLLYIHLSLPVQKSFYGKEIAESISQIDNNTTGKIAKQFSAISITEDSISLHNFKGRYVLLDFWASWCVPCRQSNPHYIELFKKYHNHGFEIIGISDDYHIDAWKAAIEKDKVGIWYNILSGFKMNKTGDVDESQWISKKFGVQVLPTKILVDRSGMIIGRYTGTEEEPALDKKLSEIFE
jgi:thiol-disulfide isomerase/thioredoxin